MHDIAVIGGGPGGYVAAIRAAQHGLKVLLIEKNRLGGACLNSGCIPTKCFVHDTRLYHTAKHAGVLRGAAALSFDAAAMLDRKRAVVTALVNGLQALVQHHRIELVQGQGILSAPGVLNVIRPDGGTVGYEARNVILATGSKPAAPSFVTIDGQFVQTTDQILETAEIPSDLIIIGGGVIGIEMAAVFLNLGVAVTIVEQLPDILVTEDRDIRLGMRRLLKKNGAELLLNTRVRQMAVKQNVVEILIENQPGPSRSLTAQRVLVAVGRTPVFDGIDVDSLQLEMNGPFVKTDAHFQTNLPGVYAIGDLTGGMMLAHKASAEAEAAVAHILGTPEVVRPERIPRCIWGITEIGAVGLTQEELAGAGRGFRSGKFHFAAGSAAMAMDHPDGFVKILGDPESGEIFGVHILGERATELIGGVAGALQAGAGVQDLAGAVTPHPTLTEALTEAAMDFCGTAIHKIRRR